MKIEEHKHHKSTRLDCIPAGECFRYCTGYQLYIKTADQTLRGDIRIVCLRTGRIYEESGGIEVVPVNTTLHADE